MWKPLTWIVTSGLLVAACAGDLDDPERFAAPTDPAAGADGGDAASPAEATPACADVPATIFKPSCAGSFCHDDKDKAAGLDLVSPDLAARVLGKPATSGGLLVDPDHPEASVLYTKVTASPPSGGRMPSGMPLADDAIACVLAWAKDLQPSGSGGKDAGPDAAMASHGNEHVWFDSDFTWDDKLSGQAVATPPPNWYASVDYVNGSIEMRIDVKQKPDATPVWLELCMWQGFLGSAAHTCLHCFDPPFSAKGVYTCKATANGPVDFHQPFVAMQHRIKDGTAGRGDDLANEKKGLPIAAHYTIVLVPAKATFSGWASYGF